MRKKTRNNQKGFTLVELLATIVVLSIVVSLTIYTALNIIGNAKEKSYKVTISNIESNASNYLLENKDKLNFVSSSETTEYQCITVKNLIDYGYLNDNITKSKVKENETVDLNRYIYVERNSTTKAITKVVYLMNNKYDQLCKASIKSKANITFSSNPGFDTWSKTKNVTITYGLTNVGTGLSGYTYNYNYTGNSTPKNVSESFNQFTEVKTTNITSNGTLLAEIKLNDDSVVTSSKEITKVDAVGPVIALNSNETNTVKATVTIPLKVTDGGSGIKKNSFTIDDIVVKIGDYTVTNATLSKAKNCTKNADGNFKECTYNLKIDDLEHAGKVSLTIEENKVFDKIDNGNAKTTLNPNITFSNVYTITYHANGGDGGEWGETWSNTATYNQDYVTPKNWYTRTGYSFNGWNEKADGTGTAWNLNSNGVYENGNGTKKWKWTYTNDIDLYAQWKANTYTVKYSCGTGTGTAPNDQTVNYDGTIQIQNGADGCSKTGHTFSNWTSPGLDGTGTANWNNWQGKWQYVNGQYGITNNTITLTAAWDVNYYYLDLNGYLDDAIAYNISGYGTVDIYVNGTLVADDVSDHYVIYPYGSTYEIKDIKAAADHVYNGVYSGSISGTITDTTGVYLNFTTSKTTCYICKKAGPSKPPYYGCETGGTFISDPQGPYCIYTYKNLTEPMSGSGVIECKVQTEKCEVNTAAKCPDPDKQYNCGAGLYWADWPACTCAGGSSGGACFLAGTKISTNKGLVDIDKIKVGDLVLSYNEETKNNEYHRVTHLYSYDPNEINEELYTLTFDDKTTLKVSSTHRIYIIRNGEALWLPTKDIKLNDIVMYSNKKYHRITNTKHEKLTKTVFNFSVENTHNYYVGKQRILVHNPRASEPPSQSLK